MIRRNTAQQLIVIGLIAAPPAVIGAFVNYPYSIVGAFVFALLTFTGAKVWPSRKALYFSLSGIVGLAITIGLDLFSRHEIVIVNHTGHPISHLLLSYGDHHATQIPLLPPASVLHVKFHDLVFNDKVDYAEAILGDGSKAALEPDPANSDENWGALRVIFESNGKVWRTRD
jgi:hypothetical protein